MQKMSGTGLMSTNQLGKEIDDLLNDLDGPGALPGCVGVGGGSVSVNVVPGHVNQVMSYI